MAVEEVQVSSESTSSGSSNAPAYDEKTVQINEKSAIETTEALSDIDTIYVPNDDDEFIDPRLKDYPIPLVAKTVDLHNDPT